MKRMTLMCVVMVLAVVLTGCGSEYGDTGVSMYRDPFGATTRTIVQEREQTKRVYKAEEETSYRTELQTDAEIRKSLNERKARESEAFYDFASSAVWAGSAPFIAIILGLFGVLIVAIRGLMTIGDTQAKRGAKMLPEYEDYRR